MHQEDIVFKKQYQHSARTQQLTTANKEQTPKTLKDFAAEEVQILYNFKSVFPFDFFPSTITIDTSKVSISDQLFFFSRQKLSFPIEEIFVVELETNLLFASLRIKDIRFERIPFEVGFLRKNEAKKARRIIQGLITVCKEKLDTSGMSKEEMVEYLEKIGATYTT